MAGGKFDSVPDVIGQNQGKGGLSVNRWKTRPTTQRFQDCHTLLTSLLRVTAGQVPSFIFTELLKKGHLPLFLKR